MYSDVYSDMYRVMYRGYSGGYMLTDKMTYGAAIETKEEYILGGYPKDSVYVIQIIE